jgi:hypothetical protein
MMEKNILEGRTGPVTQSVASVKSLLAYVGRGYDPLPEFVEMGKEEGKVVLVLSNKRDVYYTTTARVCSCPSATYRHNGPCKHQRKFFSGLQKSRVELEAESDAILAAQNGAKRLARPPKDEPLIQRGGFKPFDELPSERAAKAVPSMLIDLHDTTEREVAYHSIQDDKTMWPAEA